MAHDPERPTFAGRHSSPTSRGLRRFRLQPQAVAENGVGCDGDASGEEGIAHHTWRAAVVESVDAHGAERRGIRFEDVCVNAGSSQSLALNAETTTQDRTQKVVWPRA